MDNMTILLDCGHPPSEHSSFTTGYGVDPEGRKHCYACCAERDKTDMARTGKAVLYLTQTDGGGYEITNWPGSLRMRAHYVKKGKHNIARVRYDAYFTGPDGKQWRGTQYGDDTQIIHCKRLKSER